MEGICCSFGRLSWNAGWSFALIFFWQELQEQIYRCLIRKYGIEHFQIKEPEYVENNSTEADKVVKNIIEECYDFALVPPTKKDVGMTTKYDPYKSYNDSWNEFNKHFGLTENVAQSVPF